MTMTMTMIRKNKTDDDDDDNDAEYNINDDTSKEKIYLFVIKFVCCCKKKSCIFKDLKFKICFLLVLLSALFERLRPKY